MLKTSEELTPEEAYDRERRKIEDRVYTMLDQGLGKRDAYELLDLIDRLIDLKIRKRDFEVKR